MHYIIELTNDQSRWLDWFLLFARSWGLINPPLPQSNTPCIFVNKRAQKTVFMQRRGNSRNQKCPKNGEVLKDSWKFKLVNNWEVSIDKVPECPPPTIQWASQPEFVWMKNFSRNSTTYFVTLTDKRACAMKRHSNHFPFLNACSVSE